MLRPPASGADMADSSNPLTPSYVNSFRISAVADRLFTHIRAGTKTDSIEFFNLCLSLARGIDYAVANNEVPSRAPDLPLLLKQVCQRKNDPLLQAAIMVLMISVKNACRNRWFTEKDNEELHILSNEIGSSFCSVDMNTEVSSFLPTISTIMSRFYPQMRMGQILAFLEAKPGYGAYVKDFQIQKNGRSSPQDKIRLLVAQTDNIETSSCIISPPQVNFLLNGKGVERRTNLYMDTGPQIPTTVTHMLKYGTNLLQAVGQFNGNYIIVVAFMSMNSTSGRPMLPDYIQPAVNAIDSDSEIIEGPSRISLNCPISFRRINTPVKGHSCKHLQCFDFDNFVEINSRRPSWRCPHCNQCICFTDIHIDQNMVKVLREVGENVVDVMFSADGSWKAVTESDEHKDKPHDKAPTGPLQQESTSFPNAPVDILDLTDGDGDIEMDTTSNRDNEDKKPSPATFHGRSTANNSSVNQVTSNTSEAFQRNGLALTSSAQNQIAIPNNMQLQQYGNSNISEYGRFPTIARQVSRTPIAVQALPAQMSAGVSGNVERQQQFSRSHLNPLQVSHMTSSSSQQQHMRPQNWGHQDRSSIPAQPPSVYRVSSAIPTDRSHPQRSQNQRIPHLVTQSPGMVRTSANQPAPHLVRSQVHQGGVQSGIGTISGPAGGDLEARYIAAAQLSAQHQRMSQSSTTPLIQASRPSPSVQSVTADALRAGVRDQRGNMGVTAQPVARADTVDASAEQNWRPSGRMRGSLSGRAYSDALNQYIIQPTPPVQAARPNITSPPSVLPPQLQVLMANRQAQKEASSRGSDALPDQSAGKQ